MPTNLPPEDVGPVTPSFRFDCSGDRGATSTTSNNLILYPSGQSKGQPRSAPAWTACMHWSVLQARPSSLSAHFCVRAACLQIGPLACVDLPAPSLSPAWLLRPHPSPFIPALPSHCAHSPAPPFMTGIAIAATTDFQLSVISPDRGQEGERLQAFGHCLKANSKLLTLETFLNCVQNAVFVGSQPRPHCLTLILLVTDGHLQSGVRGGLSISLVIKPVVFIWCTSKHTDQNDHLKKVLLPYE